MPHGFQSPRRRVTSQRPFMRWIGMLLFSGVAMTAIGCADDDASTRLGPSRRGGYSSRRFAGVSLTDARPEVARAFRQYFRLDTERSTGQVLVGRPSEQVRDGEPQRVREVFGGRNRHRRVATVRMSPEAGAVLIMCQVQVERLDTSERAAFARQRGDDRPADTPIERTGNTSADRREEWVPAGRDRQTEQLILASIEERLSATRPAP